MRRFLAATAAAAAALLGGPAVAGNLGAADQVMYGVDAKSPDYTKTSFKVHVGVMVGRGTDKSVASFESGRFRIITEPSHVDLLKSKGRIDANARLDESGIRPTQVISFNYHVQAPVIIYSLLYRDTEGAVQLASWSFLWAEDDAKAFNSAFRSWMSKVQK